MNAPGFGELLRQAQGGDPQAVERLLMTVHPHLEALARHFADPTCAEESTSDLAQKASVRIWQKLQQFRGSGEDSETLARFQAWLRKVVRRLALNDRRRRNGKRRRPDQPVASLEATVPGESASRKAAAEPPATVPSPSANVRAAEHAQLVLKALAGLSDEKDREIVQLRFFEGLSLRDISERLGLSYDRVRERYRLSKQRLGRALEGLR